MGTAPDRTQAESLGEAITRGLRVPIAKPSFRDRELEMLRRPVESGWVVQGPYVGEFEERFASYIDVEHAVATTSCTTSLHLAVAALGLKPGDEVIVPAFTWVSTANVVEYMGATPRFCDIDLATYNVDTARVEELVNERTVGMIPVHMFGLCADMNPLGELARKHDLWIVEDAACALGAWQNDRHAGTFGEMGAFSFHPRKSITTGEGGMLTTSSVDFAKEARSLRDHGAGRTDLSRHEQPQGFLLADFNRLGYNYRMTDLQGALGCAQMERVDEILGERRRRAGLYDEQLDDIDWLAEPITPPGNIHGFQSYVCLFRPDEPDLAKLDAQSERRDRLMAAMGEQGVATRQGTHAAALTGFYSKKYGLRREDFPSAAIAERLSLALPLYPDMTDADQELVLSELRQAFEAS